MPRRSAGARGVTWSAFRRRALKQPGVVPATSYGRPALRACGRLMARMEENGEDLALHLGFADRDVLLQMDPEAFYLTDRYRRYPAIVVRLKRLRADLLERLVEESWRGLAAAKAAKRGAVRRRRLAART